MKTYELRVQIFRQEDGLWRAEVPDFQGCWVDAETVTQALHDIQEVAAMRIDIAEERSEPLPTSVRASTGVVSATIPLVFDEHPFKKPSPRPRKTSKSA